MSIRYCNCTRSVRFVWKWQTPILYKKICATQTAEYIENIWGNGEAWHQLLNVHSRLVWRQSISLIRTDSFSFKIHSKYFNEIYKKIQNKSINKDIRYILFRSSWWRQQMKTSSALLVLYEGKPPFTGGFPSQRPVTRSFDVFLDRRLNKRLSKQSRRWWFETPSRQLWRHRNAIF